jgi:hypothetical protein
MITIYVKQDCGCCTSELKFNDEDSAVRTLTGAGIGNGVTIVDDTGTAHTGLDTFYGFSTSEEAQDGKGLAFLFDAVTKQ